MNRQTMPYNIEAEQAVLCAIIIKAEYALPRAKSILRPEDFYLDRNRIIFETLCDGTPADLVSIKQALTDTGLLEQAGGEDYIKGLVFAASTSAGVEAHARIVKRAARRREILTLCANISDKAHNMTMDEEEVLSDLKGGVRRIEGETSHDEDQITNQALYSQIWDDLWNNQSEPGFTLGIEGIEGRHYLEHGCTHIVAAESGTGKSAFCLQVADHVATKYGTVLYFSLESTRLKLGVRQVARYSKVALTRLHKRHLDRLDDPERITEALNLLVKSPLILIDNTRYQEVEKLVSFCETAALGQKIRMIVIDYLQLMSSRAHYQNRHLELSEIAKRLNFLAKALNIPVLYVSQLGKDIEKRTNRRPTLGDIKESGDIRNHADNIIFLYAPDPSPTVYPVEAYLAKGKDQEQFSVWLEFNGNYQEFGKGCEPIVNCKRRGRL
jgi:replicative DNA helicase